MPNLPLLSEEEQAVFDYPPILSSEIKSLCFALTHDLEKKIHHLHTPTNQVGFLLQYGYFKACKRFFMIESASQKGVIKPHFKSIAQQQTPNYPDSMAYNSRLNLQSLH